MLDFVAGVDDGGVCFFQPVFPFVFQFFVFHVVFQFSAVQVWVAVGTGLDFFSTMLGK